MPARPAHLLARWRFAAKPGSWGKTLTPALMGLLLGMSDPADFVDVRTALVMLYGICLTLGIVFLNDYADQDVDGLRRRLFPHSSPKTIADGVLQARALAYGGWVCVSLALLAACVLSWCNRSASSAILGCSGFGLFAAYSLPPLRLNYRGGGEWCEAIGVGIGLPLFGWTSFGRRIVEFWAWPYWPAFVVTAWISALSSGLADETSDRWGGKRTFAVRWGNQGVRRCVAICWPVAGLLMAIGNSQVVRDVEVWGGWFAVAIFLRTGVTLRRLSVNALCDDFTSIRRYKKCINDGIMHAILTLAIVRLAVLCQLG